MAEFLQTQGTVYDNHYQHYHHHLFVSSLSPPPSSSFLYHHNLIYNISNITTYVLSLSIITYHSLLLGDKEVVFTNQNNDNDNTEVEVNLEGLTKTGIYI